MHIIIIVRLYGYNAYLLYLDMSDFRYRSQQCCFLSLTLTVLVLIVCSVSRGNGCLSLGPSHLFFSYFV